VNSDSTSVERKHELAECERCPWAEYSGYADASGPEDGSIVIVGEAPGAVETRTGIPFTGPSGRLLDKVLEHHGIDRDGVRFTNVAACHPPYRPGAGSVVPPREVISACRPRLLHELEGRETIVLLGNTAKEAVLEVREGITAVRVGPPKSSSKYPGTKIVPTVHPAACLRQSDTFPLLVKDIGKVVAKTNIGFEPPEYRVFDEPSEACRVLQELGRSFRTFAVDIECGVDKDSDFTHPDELLCIGISYAPGKAVVIGEEALRTRQVQDGVRRLLGRSKLICHNGKYDIQVLMRLNLLDDPYCLREDTMLKSYSMDERRGIHGLKYILSEEFGWPDYAAELDRYISKGDSYALIPRHVLYKYNAFDVAGTFLLREFYERKMDGKSRAVHARLIDYSHELTYVELEGTKFDLEYNDWLYDHFEELLIPAEQKMAEIVGRPAFNPRSPIQVKEVLAEMGFRVADTQFDTISELAARTSDGSPAYDFLHTLLMQKKDQKSFSTYVKGLRKRVQKDGRIYSTFLLHGSVSGRTTSRNPNLQNITRGAVLRKQFVPESGNVFVQCDYGQIEGRVMAVEADEAYLLDIFGDPSRDLFDELGTGLYGSVEAAQLKEHRVRTKAYFYGMGYGREAPSIAAEYGLPVRQVEREMAAFFARMPNLVGWRDSTRRAARSGPLCTSFDRRRKFWLVTQENLKSVENEALAFIPQSTANDINLTALCRLRRAGLHVRIPVHDSIMVECPEADKLDVAKTMVDTMQDTAREVYSDRVAFPVDYEFGLNWGELSKEDTWADAQ
jgi:uracil-DNA glycosylase family 4